MFDGVKYYRKKNVWVGLLKVRNSIVFNLVSEQQYIED